MTYHKPKRCNKCRAELETIYARRWKLSAAKWIMTAIGTHCIKNHHTRYEAENDNFVRYKPKTSVKNIKLTQPK